MEPITLSTQGCYGELYQEMLRNEPITVSSDEESSTGAAVEIRPASDPCREAGSMSAGYANGAAAGDTCGGGDQPVPFGAVRDSGPAEAASAAVNAADVDPIESTPPAVVPDAVRPVHAARLTKWGRCDRCSAPLRLRFPDAQRSSPFLGCSLFQRQDPQSCRFTRSFPAERWHELPRRVLVRRSVDH